MAGIPSALLALYLLTALFPGLPGPARAAGLKIDLTTAVQSEGGGDAGIDERATSSRTAFQVAPRLTWAWTAEAFSTDFRLAPALEFPPAGSALSNFAGDWRLRFLPRERTLLETVVHLGHVQLDEYALWDRAWRLNSELNSRIAVFRSLYLVAGYAHSRAFYSRGPGTTPSPTLAAKLATPAGGGRGKGKKHRERGAESEGTAGGTGVEELFPIPERPSASFPPQDSAAALLAAFPERRERKHGLRGGFLWSGSRFWVSNEGEIERNRSRISRYSYDGFQVNLGSGFEQGPVELSLQSSSEWRRYDQGGTASVWRLIWIAARATYQAKPWLGVFGEVQREHGRRDEQQGFAPWNFARIGLQVRLPLHSTRRHRPPELEGLGPRLTEKGWLFRFRDEGARSVHLLGTFCGWDSQAYGLQPAQEKGLWELTVALEPGVYEYAFLVDGEEWVAPPGAPGYVEDGFGHRNGVLIVEAAKDSATASSSGTGGPP